MKLSFCITPSNEKQTGFRRLLVKVSAEIRKAKKVKLAELAERSLMDVTCITLFFFKAIIILQTQLKTDTCPQTVDNHEAAVRCTYPVSINKGPPYIRVDPIKTRIKSL